jgi:hypothetical protein
VHDAWEAFESALSESGDRRRRALRYVVDILQRTTEGRDSDGAELMAAAMSELARTGGLGFEEAVAAVETAEAVGRSGWPNYYLAEAALQLGHPEIAVVRLRRIPPGYFDDRDLAWRSVRCLELAAMASVDLEDWSTAQRLVDELAATYALTGDQEDLASPRELVMKLMSTPGGRVLLQTLADSIDLAEWMDADLAASAQAAISAECGP